MFKQYRIERQRRKFELLSTKAAAAAANADVVGDLMGRPMNSYFVHEIADAKAKAVRLATQADFEKQRLDRMTYGGTRQHARQQ